MKSKVETKISYHEENRVFQTYSNQVEGLEEGNSENMNIYWYSKRLRNLIRIKIEQIEPLLHSTLHQLNSFYAE